MTISLTFLSFFFLFFLSLLDTSKGSYYANPLYDDVTDDEELKKKFPTYCLSNVWPKEDLPQLEIAFKELGKKVVEVATPLARLCDLYGTYNFFLKISLI